MKTFLKVCPDCGKEKKRRERVCENCGYDFVNNKVYSVEDDIRVTNKEIRKFLKREEKRENMKILGRTLIVGAVLLTGAYYFYEDLK